MPERPGLLPYLAVAAGIAAFSAMDALMKSASIQAGVYAALLLRCVLGAALMLPIWLKLVRKRPIAAAMRVHVQRSVVVAIMALLFFYGLVRVPIAEAIALSFIAPLIALYFAALILGETIRPRALFASLMGLAGVAVIAAARFGEGRFEPDAVRGVAAVLTSAVLYALNLVLQRRQAQLASPIEIAFVQNLFVSLTLLIGAPWFLAWPEAAALKDIAIGAVLANMALLVLSWGYAREEAQALIPIEYTGFLWAALFGWLWFDERLGLPTVAGAILIVIGCWIAARRHTEQTAL